jgi:CHAT domain-containing protein
MPFDLVPSGSGSGELLIERFDITYLPTAALLRRPPPRDKRFRFPWMRELVAFGNPVVQPQAAPLQNPDVSSALQPLPYSEVEIQSISKMTRGKADLFLGPSDLKSSFIASITKSTPIVHVSTHAYADAEVPENSRMLFSPETSKGVADYVFLRELYDLDLRDVDLATLSACNTEQGKLIRGEGVQAFSRALLSAGSRSTLTTLWRVSDQPTSEFMQQFYYFALQDRQSKAEALRSAKLKFLHSKMQFEYPAQWAGFVLSGDGLSDLPTFVSWRVLAILAVIAILLLASCFSLALRFGRRNHRVNRF